MDSRGLDRYQPRRLPSFVVLPGPPKATSFFLPKREVEILPFISPLMKGEPPQSQSSMGYLAGLPPRTASSTCSITPTLLTDPFSHVFNFTPHHLVHTIHSHPNSNNAFRRRVKSGIRLQSFICGDVYGHVCGPRVIFRLQPCSFRRNNGGASDKRPIR